MSAFADAADRRKIRKDPPLVYEGEPLSRGEQESSLRMLKPKPTRIDLKPEDREEYFAQKKKPPKPEEAQEAKDKPNEKDVRIGLSKAR